MRLAAPRPPRTIDLPRNFSVFSLVFVFPAMMSFIIAVTSALVTWVTRFLPSSGMMCRLIRPRSVILVLTFLGRPPCPESGRLRVRQYTTRKAPSPRMPCARFQRACLLGRHGSVSSELHPAPDIVHVAIVHKVCARARGQHEGAKALQIAAPKGILPVPRLGLVNDGLRQFWHMHLAKAGSKNSPKSHHQNENCGLDWRSLENLHFQ